MNSPRFLPYHNPENVDESLVPKGWRFRYDFERDVFAQRPCRQWVNTHFYTWAGYVGNNPHKTYIVPVA